MEIDENSSEATQSMVDSAFGRKSARPWQTQDALIAAPESTFGTATLNTEHLAPDNDPAGLVTETDAPRTVNDDDAIDADPYGWIAGVEAAHSDFVQEPTQPDPPYVVVWQHGMIEPQRFDYAVAKVLPNGTLLVTPRSSDVPLKGYAPGVWVTFEHIGNEYHVRPQAIRMRDDLDRARTASRPGRAQTTNYAAQERSAVSMMARSNAMLAEHADEMTQVLTDPSRRTPPTHEADSDDTQTIPVVKTEQAGGGGVRPFGRGVRPDAGSTGPTPRPDTGAPEDDEPTPGRFRSLWRSLVNPDWVED